MSTPNDGEITDATAWGSDAGEFPQSTDVVYRLMSNFSASEEHV